METILGIMIPFFGTSLGAAMVFVLKNSISDNLQKILTGFAAAVLFMAAFLSSAQNAYAAKLETLPVSHDYEYYSARGNRVIRGRMFFYRMVGKSKAAKKINTVFKAHEKEWKTANQNNLRMMKSGSM